MNVHLLGPWDAVKAEPVGPGARARWLRGLVTSDPEEDRLLSESTDPVAFQLGARILAVVVAAAAVVGTLVYDEDIAVNIVLVVATALPWALALGGIVLPRRIFAAWVLLPSAGLTVVAAFVGDESIDPTINAVSVGVQFSLFLILLMLADWVGAPRRQLAVLLVVIQTMILGRFLVDTDGVNLLIWTAALGFVAAAMIGIRLSSIALIRTRDALAAQRASEERRQIARDVHDVVAHTLAVTMLHMTAARMAVQRSAPDDAVEALEEAERHGRTSLADIRRIIRVLRADDESALDAAQPDLSDITALVERYRSAGLPVDLRAEGSTETVPATTGLAAFRITQEALANAARHGDGNATVELRVVDGTVRLSVWNPVAQRRTRSSDGHGSGLIGIRERVLAAGGTLEAGPSDGRWVVKATLPIAAAEGGLPP